MPRRERILLLVNVAVTVVVVVIGVLVGATRNPLGFLVAMLAVVFLAAFAMRQRRRLDS